MSNDSFAHLFLLDIDIRAFSVYLCWLLNAWPLLWLLYFHLCFLYVLPSYSELEGTARKMLEMFCKDLKLSRDLDPQENMHGEDLLSMASNILVLVYFCLEVSLFFHSCKFSLKKSLDTLYSFMEIWTPTRNNLFFKISSVNVYI